MNSNRYTVQTPVESTVKVFAIPRTKYEMTKAAEVGDTFPFRYEISSHIPWQSGAVAVQEVEVHAVVPAGIDLLEKTVETLNGAKKKAKQDYEAKVEELDEQINQLLLLTDQRPYGDLEDDVVASF